MGFWDVSGISRTTYKQSAPRSRQITTPTPHHSIFKGWMLFLACNRQCQSTEGTMYSASSAKKLTMQSGGYVLVLKLIVYLSEQWMSILSRQYDFLYQTRYVYHPVAELTDRESRARSSLVCLSSDKVDSWMASCAMRRASARQCSTSRCSINRLHSHHTHSFNGPLSGTIWVSWYQKGTTNLDFTEARDSEWQRLGRMQVCTSLQSRTKGR